MYALFFRGKCVCVCCSSCLGNETAVMRDGECMPHHIDIVVTQKTQLLCVPQTASRVKCDFYHAIFILSISCRHNETQTRLVFRIDKFYKITCAQLEYRALHAHAAHSERTKKNKRKIHDMEQKISRFIGAYAWKELFGFSKRRKKRRWI